MKADPPPAAPAWRHRDATRLAVVLAVALVAFSGTLRNGFVWDDILFVRDNPVLEDLRNIPAFFASGDAVGTYVTNPYYRPLATASFALDTAIWGDEPAGFHATNLLLHLGACALLFFAVKRLTGRPLAAFAAAALFAVHPAQAEPVAYVSARADLACTLLALASFLFYLRGLERDTISGRCLSWAFYLMALLTKITAGMLPALLAVHLVLVARKWERWPRLLPYLAISLVFLAIRAAIVPVDAWEDVPPGARLAAAGPFIATYMRNAVFPFGLKAFYDLPFRDSTFDPVVIAAWVVVLCGLLAVALLWHRRQAMAAFGLTWFFAGILPVSGIVITLFPAFVADRYLYFPLAGLALAFGSLVEGIAAALPAGRMRAAAGLAAAAGILAMVPAASNRVAAWQDSLSLWTAAAEDAPRSAYVLNNHGTALRNSGRLDEAEAALLGAIAIDDRTAGPHINLAGVALARRDIANAERCLDRALTLEPGNPVAINFMGVVEANRGRFSEAQRCFEEAVRIWPGYPGALLNMQRLAHLANVARGPVASLD